MTLVNAETGELVEFDRAAAERRAERITLRLDAIADNYRAVLPMIREAIEKRDDIALGYRSPGDYVSDRFGQSLAGLGIEVRRAVVGELTEAGLSTRAIAPVVGVSHKTVVKDSQAIRGGTSVPPDPDPDDVIDVDVVEDETPQDEADPAPVDASASPVQSTEVTTQPRPAAPLIGIDGKKYKRPKPKPSEPRRTPLADSAFRVIYDLGKKAESLHRLTEDDRWPQNAEKVAAKHRNDLLRINDLLQQVINSLPEQESTQ